MAGMIKHVDFDEQVKSSSGNRPDMIIKLPNSAIIPVDSKVPMKAYLQAYESQSKATFKKKMGEHSKALRDHIKSLSEKSYWSQFDVSPDFVLMFVPYESGLSAAFERKPDLLEEAIKKKVFMVSPFALLALLKVVAYGWLQLELTENARDIARLGCDLTSRFQTFLEHFNNLGSRLNSSVEIYNDAVGSMETRVLPTMRKFKEMGASTEEIPKVTKIEKRAK